MRPVVRQPKLTTVFSPLDTLNARLVQLVKGQMRTTQDVGHVTPASILRWAFA